jgi:hypothetical protein
MNSNLASLHICNQIPSKSAEIIEGFNQKDIGTDLLMKRINKYINDGILIFTDNNLSIPDAVKKRKFYAKKMTVSFIKPIEAAEWTSIQEMENRRDRDGNKVYLDPLEYQVRNLTPIEAFKKVIKERIEPIVNISFEFLEEKEKYELLDSGVLRVGFEKNKGSWSLVGLDHYFSTDEQTLNLGWLDVATMLHELGHVIGLIHEHQGPFGKPIEWDEPVVYNWAKITYGWDQKTTYDNIIKKYEKNMLNGTDFDSNSIMLYFFPPELTKNKKGSSQNLTMSMTDIKFLSFIMPGKDIDFNNFFGNIYPNQPVGLKYNGLTIGLTIGLGISFLSLISGLIYYKRKKE